jgi:hypothetical protein
MDAQTTAAMGQDSWQASRAAGSGKQTVANASCGVEEGGALLDQPPVTAGYRMSADEKREPRAMLWPARARAANGRRRRSSMRADFSAVGKFLGTKLLRLTERG